MYKLNLNPLLILSVLVFYSYSSCKAEIKSIHFNEIPGVDCSKSSICHEKLHDSHKEGSPEIFISKYKTKNNKFYQITEDCSEGNIIAKTTIKTFGFKKDKEIVLSEGTTINSVFLADLNNDGFDEIYIQTDSGNSACNDFLAYTSNMKNDLKTIKVNYPKRVMSENIRAECFSLKNGKLYIKYQIYKENDPECCPSGGEKEIQYKLNILKVKYSLESKSK